jgi:hypothetical protein
MTKKMGNGDHTVQTHVGLESAVEPLWWDSVLNLSNVYSSAFQTAIKIKYEIPFGVGEFI